MSRIDSRREGILVADRWHFLDSGLTEDGSHDLIPVTCETGADPVGLHMRRDWPFIPPRIPVSGSCEPLHGLSLVDS
jgi:hypothetical protein